MALFYVYLSPAHMAWHKADFVEYYNTSTYYVPILNLDAKNKFLVHVLAESSLM